MIQWLATKLTTASVVTSLTLAPCALFLTHLSHHFFFPPVEMMSTAFLVLTEKASSRPLLCISQNRGPLQDYPRNMVLHMHGQSSQTGNTFYLVILLFSGISSPVSCNRTTDKTITVSLLPCRVRKLEFLDSDLGPDAGHRYGYWCEFSYSLQETCGIVQWKRSRTFLY